MSEEFRFQLKFWGVRGSIPVPQQDMLGFGGNTTCLEVGLPSGEIIIIDGGSGVRNLGMSLLREHRRQLVSLHFFLTHFHWDHIQGLPFFAPLYDSANQVTFHASRPVDELQETLEGQMSHPYFPVRFEMLAAKRNFVELAFEPIRYGEAAIYPFPLNHPQNATGFRLELNGAAIVHASDTEHGNPELDKIVREYSREADILIYDSQYTPEEYESRKGWGHSTWLEATRVARDAKVKQLILFHHDPTHDDAFIENIVQQARQCFPASDAAREGWKITL